MKSSREKWRRRWTTFAVALFAALISLVGPAGPAAAASYVPISGAGSTWSYNAIHAWTGNVAAFGMRVDYARIGSDAGRSQYRQGIVDWAASDIPYGASDDPPPSRGFAYMPDTAGGTAFMYNLKIGTSRVTNLRLSGENLAKIFTGVLTKWNDPAIAADNPDLTLPAITIVPVVRSDGAGSTAHLTQWMSATEGQYWTAYCAKVGLSPCIPTSTYPVLNGSSMIGQSGDLGVSGYVSQLAAVGTIGYVEYSYALQFGFPVAKVLNAAGYYTEPTAGHVGVSLLNARINMDLTADLSQVYTDPDPRTYELSSYSYMILPTATEFGFTTNKGFTLGDFGKYLLCQGQSQAAALGYSPLPINLVEAGFAQLQRIPGAQVPQTTTDILRSCNNPTFSTDGTNTLVTNDPLPLPCDKVGAVQCAAGNGTGGVLSETINLDVPSSEGVFTLTVSGTPVQLSDAVLSADSTTFESTGRLGTVTISDGRSQTRPGWSVSGQVSDFTGGARPFSGSYLGWTPAITTQDPADDVVAGPAVLPGATPGLKDGSDLANPPATKGLLPTVLDAALDLKVPASTAAGSYSATLTITAVE